MTNAPFSIDTSSMVMPTALINDFKAIAYAVATLGVPEKLQSTQINPNSKLEIRGRIGIHGVVTGFGTARLEYDHEKKLYLPLDSEGGHKFLPVNVCDETETKISKFLRKYTNRRMPTYEDVLSGRGIEHVFNYFITESRANGKSNEMISYLNQLNVAEDKAAYIATKAYKLKSPDIFLKTMDFFWKTYGRALHDLAVHENARGGIWIAGGIIRKNLDDSISKSYRDRIEKTIMEEFNSGPTHRDWVGRIPVKVIMDKRTGLEGCIQVAANEDYMNLEKWAS